MGRSRWVKAGVAIASLGVISMGCAAAPTPAPAGGARGAGSLGPVRPGITVLLTDSIHIIRGKRVGLITNQTGIDEHGVSDIDLLRDARARAAGVQLVALYSPEHGIRGTEDRENLASGIDAASGLTITSLYTNGTIAPPDSTLRNVEVLVVDLQDIGTRTWTFTGAMVYAMRAAARNHLTVVVLDRPNPLGGLGIDGPVLDPTLANAEEPAPGRPGRAFALYPAPLRHGMTMAEMARFLNVDLGIGADLRVVPAAGWRRSQWFDQTALPWVRPSPNLPTLASSTTYPALVAFEATNVSVGRGTALSFQHFGAPWLSADSVVRLLQARGLPGVRFERDDFMPVQPGDGKYASLTIPGVRIVVTDRDRFAPGRTGAAILWAIGRSSAESLTIRNAGWDERFGRPAMRQALLLGEDPDTVVARDSAAVAAWVRHLDPYRMYPDR